MVDKIAFINDQIFDRVCVSQRTYDKVMQWSIYPCGRNLPIWFFSHNASLDVGRGREEVVFLGTTDKQWWQDLDLSPRRKPSVWNPLSWGIVRKKKRDDSVSFLRSATRQE